MQFHFSHEDRILSERFISLCRERGIHGHIQTVDHYWKFRVTVDVKGKELEALTEEWSRRSIARQN